MKELVTALIVKNGKLLMVKRKLGYYVGKWMFPIGFIEENESALEALKRELEKKFGIEIKSGLHCFSVLDIDPTSGKAFRHHIFLIKAWKGDFKHYQEFEKVNWFTRKEIENLNAFPVTFHMLRCLS